MTCFFGVSSKERSVLVGNVNRYLQMMSAIERCLLYNVRYIEFLLWEFDRHFIRSWEKWEKCTLQRSVHYKEVSV